MAAIEHVFVLMMENRSFDHFFGLSKLPGIPWPTHPEFKGGAEDQMPYDPAHDHESVEWQVNGGAMDHFGKQAMVGFEPDRIPVVTTLARNYLLMDNWYSPMQGPTWPNRFFAHAASSGGLSDNPRWFDYASTVMPFAHFRFDKGHIFDRLVAHGRTWRVYHGTDWPQVLSLEGMAGRYANDRGNVFRPNKQLPADLLAGDAATYTWIEPTHSAETTFVWADSQHPRGSVQAGERLIQNVYNAVRASPLWDRSLLVITWDEHGGFYDRQDPGDATPPGDVEYNRGRSGGARDCKFDKLGPRVPALLISPLLPSGLGSTVFPRQKFDHSCIVASLREQFGLGQAFTARDEKAPSWVPALDKLRTVPTGKLDLATPEPTGKAAVAPAAVNEPPDATLAGFALIAKSLDLEIAAMQGRPPIAAKEQQAMERASRVLSLHGAKAAPATALAVQAHRDVLRYMAAVRERERDFRAGR